MSLVRLTGFITEARFPASAAKVEQVRFWYKGLIHVKVLSVAVRFKTEMNAFSVQLPQGLRHLLPEASSLEM